MSEKELLDNIRIYQFAAIDLNLFLDNFPEDKDAKKDYETLSYKLICLINEYEKNYGPLTNFGTSFKEDSKAWVEKPWPWENYD
ncbi:spore coat protein CotJB [Clostridium sp. CTA-5]